MLFLRKLYRGETDLDFVGYRKRWYIISGVLLIICLGSMVFRGFNFGIEFKGGNQFIVPAKAGITLEQVRGAVEDTGTEVATAQTSGSGGSAKYVIRTGALRDDRQREEIKTAIAHATHLAVKDINSTSVSSSWGRSVTQQALTGLVVFLIAVGIYIWIRFEQKMAFAALFALVHDLLLTAGVYSISGFEVTPGTVVGLLTILGYSLYDTVVVFDKVEENTRGILGHNRFSYGEAANTAVNQTLMRSINTSLIALLPVGGLLFIGAGILGVGTLKDLALVLFVGMLTGAYSSLFLATPWLVDLKLLDPRFKLHAQRVATRKAGLAKGEETRPARTRAGAGKAATREAVPAGAGKVSTAKAAAGKSGAGKGRSVATADVGDDAEDAVTPSRVGSGATAAPRPGARAGQRKRQSGRRR